MKQEIIRIKMEKKWKNGNGKKTLASTGASCPEIV